MLVLVSWGFGPYRPRTSPLRGWSELRVLRHKPPGRAHKGVRKDEFDAAMEQGEQLARAAAMVSPAASPLLLFYAYAQVGRAIAASSTRLTIDGFRGSGGHGLKVRESDGIERRGVAALKIIGDGHGSHGVLASALGASCLKAENSFGTLWSLLSPSDLPLPGASVKHGALELRSVGRWILPVSKSLEPASELRGPVVDAIRVTRNPSRRLSESSEVPPPTSELRAAYPELITRHVGERPFQQVSLTGECLSPDAVLRVFVREGETAKDMFRRIGANFCGTSYVYPTLDETGRQAHPFLLWWEVLYALSQLARYQPREWTQLIDISRHSDAAPLEAGLTFAIESLPELALDALSRAVDQAVSS